MQPGELDRGDDVGGQAHLAAEAAADVDGPRHHPFDGDAEALGGEFGHAFHRLRGHLDVEGAFGPMGEAGMRFERGVGLGRGGEHAFHDPFGVLRPRLLDAAYGRGGAFAHGGRAAQVAAPAGWDQLGVSPDPGARLRAALSS